MNLYWYASCSQTPDFYAGAQLTADKRRSDSTRRPLGRVGQVLVHYLENPSGEGRRAIIVKAVVHDHGPGPSRGQYERLSTLSEILALNVAVTARSHRSPRSDTEV